LTGSGFADSIPASLEHSSSPPGRVRPRRRHVRRLRDASFLPAPARRRPATACATLAACATCATLALPAGADAQAPPERRDAAATGADLALGVADDRAALRGRVLDAQGRPVTHAQVAVHGPEGTSGLPRGAAVDAAGRFIVPGLPAGRYRVRVTALGYAPDERGWTAPADARPTARRRSPSPSAPRARRSPACASSGRSGAPRR
jgi:hypothetical protein